MPARKDDVMKRIASLLFMFSSPPVRYAILAYAAFRFNRTRPQAAFKYLDLCYKHLRKAISSAALVDIVYASYLVCLLAREMGEPPNVVSIHGLGLSQALKTLKSTPSALSPNEWFSLEHSCHSAFVDIRNQETPRLLTQSSLTEFRNSKFAYSIEELFVQAHSCYSTSVVPEVTIATQTRDLQLALTFSRLGNSFGFYLNFYLWRLNNPIQGHKAIEEPASELRSIIKELTDFLPKYNSRLCHEIQNSFQIGRDDFVQPLISLPMETRDIECCSLYFTATLVQSTLLSQPSLENDAIAIQSATSLCRTFAAEERGSHTVQMNWPRDVFLAGLILTKSHHPHGTSLCLYGLRSKPTRGSGNAYDVTKAGPCGSWIEFIWCSRYWIERMSIQDEICGLSNAVSSVYGSVCLRFGGHSF